MTNSNCIRLFIYLFIAGIHIWAAYAYGDPEFNHNDFNLNESTQGNLENLNEASQNRHRAKRAVTDDSATATGPYTSTLPSINARVANLSNSSDIYIITNLYYPSDTTASTIDDTGTTDTTSTSQTSTYSSYNGTYIITSYVPITTITTTSQTTTTLDPNFCTNGTYILLSNGTCTSRDSAQIYAISILYANSSSITEKADALSLYINSITNSNISSNSNNTLSINEINTLVGSLNGNYAALNDTGSVLIITKPGDTDVQVKVIGVSYQENMGGTIVNVQNRDNVTSSNVSTAGIVTLSSLFYAASFNMFIINDPTPFENADNTSNRTISSSIVMSTIETMHNNRPAIDITLYFQVVKPPTTNGDVTYSCAFYDKNTSQWSESGCSPAIYNKRLDRYECNCDHLTSFALVWLPKPLGSSSNLTIVELNAQDKASIAFQVISICCFIAAVIHGVILQFTKSRIFITLRLLLPIISCIVTLILFIFWIALCLTVYSRFSQASPSSQNRSNQGRSFQENFKEFNLLENRLDSRIGSSSVNSSPRANVSCLPAEQDLMFVVYFLIIFMFCVKTSIGYFNYRRFVQLFPPPPLKSLLSHIAISFVISITLMMIAAGVNSNPSNNVTEIYLGKVCWFSQQVIHIFLTAPICVSLAINLVIVVLVAKKMIDHARDGDSSEAIVKRTKYCVIVLLTSCLTQGLGWLFGPIISIANPNVAEGLGWLFVIINGLEGVWILILYIIARKSHMDERQRETQYRTLQTSVNTPDTNRNLPDKDAGVDGIMLDDLTVSPRLLLSHDPHIMRRSTELKEMKSDSPRNSVLGLDARYLRHRPLADDRNESM
ncbi:unnamed protein product [Rotaria socialis]|uniref:GAIN-B domain-containing protein n=1 Tax=Rotaria socialis TaxID=392032 RepID=A0A820YRY1_9BILA|nr:unnamed protein product [Rotaria socialis]CAF4552648.1 unnamed protein product [Rotaria socialis]